MPHGCHPGVWICFHSLCSSSQLRDETSLVNFVCFLPWTPLNENRTVANRWFHFHRFLRSSRSCLLGPPGGASGKEPACRCRRPERLGINPCVRKTTRRREWQPPPVFLSRESHGQRRLAGCSRWGRRVRHCWSDLAACTRGKMTTNWVA